MVVRPPVTAEELLLTSRNFELVSGELVPVTPAGREHGVLSAYLAPDLAVEVRSPDNTLAELSVKANEYLEAGARMVWIVDPPTRTVQVMRPGRPAVTLSLDDVLDGGDVLPGFSLPVSRLFAELD